MTENDWLSCDEPEHMLHFLRDRGLLSDRKARLFAVACCRRVWSLLKDDQSRRAVEVAEAFADGSCGADDLTGVYYAANTVLNDTDPTDECYHAAASLATAVAYTLPLHGCYCTALAAAAVADTVADANQSGKAYRAARGEELAAQCRLLRDVFSPFRPVTIDLPCLTPPVVSLAQSIYQDRSFDRLPELARAFADAGCTDAGLLGHLRSRGQHVSGCFSLDAVLGKS